MRLIPIFLATALLFPAAAQAQPKPLKVLTISGDWKSQAWYQDVWMQGKGENGKGTPPVKYRGRFIADAVEKAAPGQFQFTDITNYTGQQYGDAAYFSQFDVVLAGDIVGWSLPPRFLNGLQDFVQNGGGFVYAASYKWHTALLDGTPFEAILPAKFGVSGLKDDWKNASPDPVEKNFQAVPAEPDNPVVHGLDWAHAPTLDRLFTIQPKPGAEVVLKSTAGAPLLALGNFGQGRTALSASIFANDQLSSKIGEWPDFGKYYAQLFTWLGTHSQRKAQPLRDAIGQVAVTVDASRAANPVTSKIFSIHASHDNPGLAPLEGEALKNFQALNLDGAFSRVGGLANVIEKQNDNEDPNTFNWAAYDFTGLDKQLAAVKALNLEPIVLFELNYGKPEWLWKGMNSTWSAPTDQCIVEAAELVAAAVEHANGGKGGDPNYKLNVRYIEFCNEPDLNSKTIPGFVKLFKGVAARIHRDYPGVQIGTFGGYEVPYLKEFLSAVDPDLDWVSRHPYGWTGETLFAWQDEVTAYQKEHNLRQIPFIITEWDFWIQGRPKFDYMMTRYFEAVRRENLLGTLHYRLGQYGEPIYMFGLLWVGWGKDKGAGEKGTPMHDGYDALWLFRDFRGRRVAVEKTAGGDTSPLILDHIYADATSDGDKLDVVLYEDWAYEGTGFKDYARGLNYPSTKVKLRIQLAPANRARQLTVAKANGEGFEAVGEPVTVAAGEKVVETTVEVSPMEGFSLSLK